MPEPEELIANTPQARAEAQKERHRPGFEDTVWFRMDIGRSQNADPRWILPLLCRRGHVTRGEIGAIRIGQAETYFQIPRTIAAKFADAAARTAQSEGDEEAVMIERSETGPREVARNNRQLRPSRSTADNGFVKAKPAGKTFARKPNAAPGAPGAKPWQGKKPGPNRNHRPKHKQP